MAESDAGMLVTSEPDKTYVQKPSEPTDADKRDMIVDVLGVRANTVAGLSGDDLNASYQRALKASEGRNMGGVMDEKLGYNRGGMAEEKRGPIKYSKGGAVKGRNYRGSF